MEFLSSNFSPLDISAQIRKDRLEQRIIRSSRVYCKYICKNENCKLPRITQCERLIEYTTSTEEDRKMGVGVAIKEFEKIAIKCPICSSSLGRFYITSNPSEIKRAQTNKKLYNMLAGYHCDHCIKTLYFKDLKIQINNNQKSSKLYHSKFRSHIFTQQTVYLKKFSAEGV